MSQISAFADFEAFSEGDAGENNGWERVDSGLGRALGLIGEVRKFPQEPAQTRGNWRDQTRKPPTDKSWDFKYWGGGYRTSSIGRAFKMVKYSIPVSIPAQSGYLHMDVFTERMGSRFNLIKL